MAFSDYRITNFEKPVSALADTPQMSADALKEWFDSNSTGELKTSVNGIIDEAEQLETAVSGKVDKVDGKGLSTNDFTTAEKTKLAGVEPAMQHTHANKAVLDTVTEPLINARGGVGIGSDGTSATEGGAVGRSVHAALGGAIGSYAQSYNGGAVGHGAKTSDGFAGGYYAKAMNANGNVIDAVQLGTGTNSTEKTLQVYGYRMMEANGKIPDARLNDAPSDSKQYVRKDGSWVEMTKGLPKVAIADIDTVQTVGVYELQNYFEEDVAVGSATQQYTELLIVSSYVNISDPTTRQMRLKSDGTIFIRESDFSTNTWREWKEVTHTHSNQDILNSIKAYSTVHTIEPAVDDDWNETTNLDNLADGLTMVTYSDGLGKGGYLVLTVKDGAALGYQIKIAIDGTKYRYNNGGAWTPWKLQDGTIPEAPKDEFAYVRKNGNWVAISL